MFCELIVGQTTGADPEPGQAEAEMLQATLLWPAHEFVGLHTLARLSSLSGHAPTPTATERNLIRCARVGRGAQI